MVVRNASHSTVSLHRVRLLSLPCLSIVLCFFSICSIQPSPFLLSTARSTLSSAKDRKFSNGFTSVFIDKSKADQLRESQ